MAALRFVRSVLKSFHESSGLEPRLFGENLRVTAAEPGRVDFELDIKKEHTVRMNRLEIIHGGTIASMVDLGGSLAVASQGLHATGVSTDMNIGKTLAYTSIQFTNAKGQLAARGSHTKKRFCIEVTPVL
ncbi:_thioesterase family protein [Rutstroemia sp. NJR-2017a BBW]|nr:_thioesterase family protein [Rutstroemia sp. NJR-2017a BBW]